LRGKSEVDKTFREDNICLIESTELFTATHELENSGHVEGELVEEYDLEVVELRDVDARDQVFQVLANTFESQRDESGEDGACLRRWASAGPIGVRWRGAEMELKEFESGDCR